MRKIPYTQDERNAMARDRYYQEKARLEAWREEQRRLGVRLHVIRPGVRPKIPQ